jgi:Uma2 family endonuclease
MATVPATFDRRGPGAIPPLESGDRLSRDEFERRYAAMPELRKAELIEGVVYAPPPVSDSHSGPHFNVITWMGMYAAATPGVHGGDNGTLRLDLDNAPQPDAFLRIDKACGGQTHIDRDGFVCGPPELVVEVASSTASYDLHAKLQAFRRNGVREYLVWRVWDSAIDWFVLREARYQRLAADKRGIRKSEVFPGLWLHSAALLTGDVSRALKVLQRGLASRDHQRFVARLKAAGRN